MRSPRFGVTKKCPALSLYNEQNTPRYELLEIMDDATSRICYAQVVEVE